MDGWMNTNIDEQLDGQKKRDMKKIDGWLDVQEPQKDGWLGGQKNRWLDEYKKWMNGWLEG